MYYREKQDPMPDRDGNQLWRPEIVRTGKIVDVKELSKLISTATTVTQADIAAVLYSLPQFMNVHLKEGHTIRLDGLGTFTVYGRSKGKGVLEKKDVRPSQFGSLVLKFTPEYSISVGGVRTRALLNDIEFTHIDRLVKGLSGTSDNNNTGDNNGDNDGGNNDNNFVDPAA
ncbi:MAG: HU family DNA-binding protein [Bacteroides sp.]|nr:HU family DNA-binding protein [Bacteroides sp.]